MPRQGVVTICSDHEPAVRKRKHGTIRAQILDKMAGRVRRASVDGRLFLGGTDGSNPVPSSGQSVSRRISPFCIEKPAVAAARAGPPRRHGRQRRAGLVNVTPTAGNISVGPYSSTAMPASGSRPRLHWCAKRGRVKRCDQALSSVRLRQSRARCAAGTRSAADANAPAACLRSDRAADGRRGWLR